MQVKLQPGSSFTNWLPSCVQNKASLNPQFFFDRTENINYTISQICEQDKQAIKREYTVSACQSQLYNDNQDVIDDDEERKADARLTEQYNRKLPELYSRLNRLELSHTFQQTIHSQTQKQRDTLKHELSQLNSRMRQIRAQKRLLTLQFPYTNTTVYSNYHSHYPNVPSANYPNTSCVWTLTSQLEWNRLLIQEDQLSLERQSLKKKINNQEYECYTEQKKLNSLYNDKNQLEQEIRHMRHQLNTVFPDNEKQRQVRMEERLFREKARAFEDPQLNQLSYHNRNALKQQIATQFQALNRQKESLMQQANKSSYPLFISQLEQVLQSQNSLKLLYNENEALKSIIAMMKEFKSMENKEQTMTLRLQSEESKLKKLQHNLQENHQLNETNTQLKLDSDYAGSIRNSALFVGFAGITSGTISAVMIGAAMANPLLFMIPGGLALFSIASLTVGLVYHFKKSNYEDQIDLNKKSMQNNEIALLEPDNNPTDTNSPKPTLKQQIEQVGQNIDQQSKQLKEHQGSMNQLLSKAQNVTTNYQRIYPFFPPTGEYPSAPPQNEYDVDALKYSTYNG